MEWAGDVLCPCPGHLDWPGCGGDGPRSFCVSQLSVRRMESPGGQGRETVRAGPESSGSFHLADVDGWKWKQFRLGGSLSTSS